MTAKKYPVVKGENVEGGEAQNGCRGVFKYYILPMGKKRKKLGKAKIKGREKN